MSMTIHSLRFRALRHRAKNTPWLGSALAAAAAFFITVANGQMQGIGGLFAAALSFSALTVLVALGQMLVISAGPGNADLSIPSTIALSSAVSMLVMDGRDAMVLPGLLAAAGVGAVVGLLNFSLIRLLRIPPIIATLANSLIVMSWAISLGRGLKIKPPPIFIELVTSRLDAVPLLSVLAMVISLLIWLVVERTVFGRSLCALGQNARAAEFAGVHIVRTALLAYVICATLAGITGALIAGFAGGNSLDQGEEYLLLTIAVVVIGGTSVSGGRPCVPGIWGAALFMFLLVAMLNASGASAGLRMVLTGVIIITVIALAGPGSDSS